MEVGGIPIWVFLPSVIIIGGSLRIILEALFPKCMKDCIEVGRGIYGLPNEDDEETYI